MAPEEHGALTEGVFYILLALHQPLHGYGIMQFVQDLTEERVALGPGTLYGALNTLVERKWIKALGDQKNSRRKEYVITDRGKHVFQAEIERLEQLLKHAGEIHRREEA